jgi:hypothetical protein
MAGAVDFGVRHLLEQVHAAAHALAARDVPEHDAASPELLPAQLQ